MLFGLLSSGGLGGGSDDDVDDDDAECPSWISDQGAADVMRCQTDTIDHGPWW